MYEPLKEHKSTVLGDVLETAWENETQKAKKVNGTPCFHRVIFKVFGGKFMLFGLLHAFLEIGIKYYFLYFIIIPYVVF